MSGLTGILQGVTEAFDRTGAGFAAIPLSFLFGLLSALASACCALPVVGMVAGYAGARRDGGTRDRIASAGCFMLGTALALVLLGAAAATVGQVAQTAMGRYWKIPAGILAVVTGLGALNLLPVNPSTAASRPGAGKAAGGRLGPLLFGFAGGGAVSVCSLACNPGIFIIIGAAMLKGFTLWTAAILVFYALGFALPLGALMLGVSFAAAAAKLRGIESAVRRTAGVILVAVGFYLFWTF